MRPILAVLAVLVLSACGDETAPGTTSTDQRYTTTATVLESPDHGPQLCLGGVDDSLPPQCGGPDITNWEWSEVEAESASGTTWGIYTVVGTYDRTAFTLTETPRLPVEQDRGPDFQIGTPCDEPDGGWVVVDDSTATDEAMNAAIEYANQQSDFAGVWLDQSINEDLATASDDEIESVANDPRRLILNVSFTGDVDRHETALREIWGGALCVVLADRSEAELLTIQQELHEDYDGVLGSGTDVQTGQVTAMVIVDDGTLQAELDERYGQGVVVVTSALRPVD